MDYNWQQKGWPEFKFSVGIMEESYHQFLLNAGRINGQFSSISEESQAKMLIEVLLIEALRTSKIEGEFLSREDVISSIKKNLGVHEEQPKLVKDHRARGIAKLMTTVRETWNKPLDVSLLFRWHEMLMEGNRYIRAGKWRSGSEPMQVISGAFGKEKVHFEAPPSNLVAKEMEQFISWFNSTGPTGKGPLRNPVLRAALTHLYFESIHPFEDGNGRIGRALAEKALHQGVQQSILISLSQVIEENRSRYYDELKRAQRTLDVDQWLIYFGEVVLEAQNKVQELIDFTLLKINVFDTHRESLNDRQVKVLNRMFEEGPDGFEGGINAKKYISLTSVSKATATRDLQNLRDMGIIEPIGGGRSLRYKFKL